MIARSVISLGIAALLITAGCKGEPKLEDIEGWIRAGQTSKVQEFVTNTDSPMALRVATVQKLVEYGQTTEVQSVMENVPDRDEFVSQCVKSLIEDLGATDVAVQVESKDALFILLNYLDDKRKDEVLAKMAKWAFHGLSAKSTKEELVSRIERLRIIGQLNRMGQHAIPTAAWLVSYGVETQSLQNFLAEAEGNENQMIVISSVKKLFGMENLVIPWEILDIARAFAIPQTVEFLIGVYMSDRFPGSARSSALAAAQDLIYGIGEKTVKVHDTPSKRRVVLKAITELMKSQIATDRWDAADMILHVGGPESVDLVVAGLKADIPSYVRFTPEEEIELADFVIIDMCNTKLRPKSTTIRPLLEAWLPKGDAAQKAFAILCLKVLGEPASIEKLKLATAGEESLETFFFAREERAMRKPLIAEEKLVEVTVGTLAQNAIDGINMLEEIEAARAAKTMPDKEADLRGISAVSVIQFTGEQFVEAVNRTYLKKSGQAPKPTEDGGAKDGTDKKPAPKKPTRKPRRRRGK